MKKFLGKALLLCLVLAVAFVFIGCSKKEEAASGGAAAGGPAVQSSLSNNTFETAQLITAGSTVNGTLTHDDDVRFFKFVLTESGKFTAWTESNIDIYTLDINFYDSDGDLDDWVAGSYISGMEGDRRVEANLRPGTYAIEVEGYEAGSFVLKTQFVRQ